MSDLIADGLASLNEDLRDFASTTFTYRRGAASLSIAVTIESADVNPFTLLAGVVADRDLAQPSPKHADHLFSFAAEDLILSGSLTTPHEADTLERTVSGVTAKYVLSEPIDGSRSWRYADGYETGPEARIYWNGRLKSVT